MQVNGASNFNIADFNPTVPICDGCLGFPFKKEINITSPFCQRRISKSTGRVYYHSGTDYGGSENEEVIAVADGTVVTPLVSGGYNPGLVDIVHEQLGNLLSRSAHIIPSVQPGTKVKQGDVIGKIGPYGNNAAHLHLELRKDKGAGGSASSEQECKTTFLDPALFCKRS
jgi:murein DD-endopeptidase MepM/ murein hydrolase activator NlpD